MKQFLGLLLFIGVAHAPMASGRVQIADHVGIVDVRTYLAPCLSSANVNACATSAANRAKQTGRTLYFPVGTYLLSDWSPPCPLHIVGDGEGQTVFRRPDYSDARSVIILSSCGGLYIGDLTIDGNKANNSRVGYSVVFNRDWNITVEDVEIKNAKGPGSALTLQNMTDDSNNTQSQFSRLYIHDNGGNGIYFQHHAWNWTLRESVIRNNEGIGVSVIDYVFPPVVAQFSNCAIINNTISSNTGSGVSLTSGITGGTSERPTNGPYNTIENCKISGNQVNYNSYYGIIVAGGLNIEIASNTTTHNGSGAGSIVAGINSALCERCDIHDNIVQYNAFYGLDTGGAIKSKVHNNTITNNGNSNINSGNGINCGACQNVDIVDNVVSANGWTAGGSQIHVTTYDGGLSGFPISARKVSIRRNHLICANSNEVGVLVLSDPPFTTIEDNWTEGCATLKGYVLHVTNAQVHGNRQDNWSKRLVLTAQGTNAIYPDAVENIALASLAGDTIAALLPHFYFTNFQTVYAVVVTGGGSSYSTSPTVIFSGGGCGTEPTGKVFQDNTGHVVGVNLTTYGAGCTSPPAVKFMDSTGSEAAATAYVLSALPINGRELSVLWPRGVKVTHDPNNLNLIGNVSFTVPRRATYASIFKGCGDHWTETVRNRTSGDYSVATQNDDQASHAAAVARTTSAFRR